MFCPENIKSIKKTDKVLEIGPGEKPYHRADVLLEKKFINEDAYAQRGYRNNLEYKKPIIYYDGKKFPFKDKEFDYVICTHVLEHIPQEELDLFISEMQRVAKRGYIEFPNIFYELINYQKVHLWLMNYRDNTILFLDKNFFSSNFIHKSYREMFYGPDNYIFKAIKRYKEFFCCGFEWEDTIKYEIVNNFDELINEYDYNKNKFYFQNFILKKPQNNYFSYIRKFIIVIKIMLNRIFKKSRIAKSAILDNKKFIKIHKKAEIKEFVIIKTSGNNVTVGEYSQINPFTVIYGGSGVSIGKNVMIAPHCMIAAGNHDYKQTKVPMRFASNLTKGPIIIEDNVWIGANCTITDGVTIGKDALVGANSVVKENVKPYDIVAGVPAKVIGNRNFLS